MLIDEIKLTNKRIYPLTVNLKVPGLTPEPGGGSARPAPGAPVSIL